MIDARYTYTCDTCGKQEAFDVASHAEGWIQYALAGDRPSHFCSPRCLILHVLYPAPKEEADGVV